MRFRRRVAGVAALLAGLLIGACGVGSSPVGTASAPTRPSTTAPGGNYSVTPTSVAGSTAVSHLTAVRAAAQSGFDRVVFEFADGLPGYAVAYVDGPVLEDASGKEITVGGAAVLQMRMVHGSGVDLSASGARTTYTGPARVRPTDTKVVREVVRSGDFEGTLTWVVGVAARAPFRVWALTSPARLVVDVQVP